MSRSTTARLPQCYSIVQTSCIFAVSCRCRSPFQNQIDIARAAGPRFRPSQNASNVPFGVTMRKDAIRVIVLSPLTKTSVCTNSRARSGKVEGEREGELREHECPEWIDDRLVS